MRLISLFNHQGRGLKVNRSMNFSCIKMCSLGLVNLKTEGQTENLTEKLLNLILADTGLP